MAKILLLHGPNLNLLGQREPEVYGRVDLDSINSAMLEQAAEMGHDLAAQQSNAEHELVEIVQAAPEQHIQFIIINPAAFTHTSVALRDALAAVAIPFIEVHLSNVYQREPFRHQSYFSDIAEGVVAGFGKQSYLLALQAANQLLQNKG